MTEPLTVRFSPEALVLIYDAKRKIYQSLSRSGTEEELCPEEVFEIIQRKASIGQPVFIFNRGTEDAIEAIELIKILPDYLAKYNSTQVKITELEPLTIRFTPGTSVLLYDARRKTYQCFSRNETKGGLSPEEACEIIQKKASIGQPVFIFSRETEDAFEVIQVIESLPDYPAFG